MKEMANGKDSHSVKICSMKYNVDKPRISPNAVEMKIRDYECCIKIASHSNCIAYLQYIDNSNNIE